MVPLVVGGGRLSGVLLTLVLLLSSLGEARALALRGPPPEMSIEDVPVGRAPGAGRAPAAVKLVNTGGEPVVVEMRLSAVGPGELKDGYEPVKSLSWVTLDKPRLELAPGQEAQSALRFSLPKDLRLQGGQYQLLWTARATAKGGARLDLRSQLLIRVADDDASAAEARLKVRGKGAAGFALAPAAGRAEGVPLGRAVDLRGYGVTLKLANPNARPGTFLVSIFSTEETLDSTINGRPEAAAPGFSPAPNPHFLRPVSPVVSVRPDGVGEARFELRIPDEPRYRGKRWEFKVRVELLEADQPEPRDFRLFVTTQGEKM